MNTIYDVINVLYVPPVREIPRGRKSGVNIYKICIQPLRDIPTRGDAGNVRIACCIWFLFSVLHSPQKLSCIAGALLFRMHYRRAAFSAMATMHFAGVLHSPQ